MREIKFRAYHRELKLMCDPFPLFESFDGPCMYNCWVGTTQYLWYPNQVELMMNTGLKDANGKGIYEGDIVVMFPGFGCEWRSRVGIIKYKYASFWVSSKGRSDILDDHDAFFEIIGNRFENPELIESQAGAPQ